MSNREWAHEVNDSNLYGSPWEPLVTLAVWAGIVFCVGLGLGLWWGTRPQFVPVPPGYAAVIVIDPDGPLAEGDHAGGP